MILASEITQDLENRDARLVAVIAELPDGKLQLIHYQSGKDRHAMPVFISDAVNNMSISAHKYGNVYEPVCQINKLTGTSKKGA